MCFLCFDVHFSRMIALAHVYTVQFTAHFFVHLVESYKQYTLPFTLVLPIPPCRPLRFVPLPPSPALYPGLFPPLPICVYPQVAKKIDVFKPLFNGFFSPFFERSENICETTRHLKERVVAPASSLRPHKNLRALLVWSSLGPFFRATRDFKRNKNRPN